jgi:hypothetical protein
MEQQSNPEDYYEEIQKINASISNDGNSTENYEKYYRGLSGINDRIKKDMDKIINRDDSKEKKLYEDYRTIFEYNYLTNWGLVIGILILVKYMFDSLVIISNIK